jgi:16S rRNA (guanine527-N7)-methyltransferase
MQSGSVAEGRTPEIPPDLRPDHSKFEAVVHGSLYADRISVGLRADLARLAVLVYGETERVSLVARGDRTVLFTRHVLDSLNPLSVFPTEPGSAIDVGSGGGFPGLALAIVWRETQLILLEAKERKAGFLEKATRTLALGNVRVICARLEDYGTAWSAPPVAAVFIRGVGNLPTVLIEASRVAQPGGQWVYFMGAEASEARLVGTLGSMGRGARLETGAFGGRLLVGQIPGARTA